MSERSIFEEVAGSFRGPQGWLVALVWIFALIFTLLFIYAAAGMLASEALHDRICYATMSIWAVVFGLSGVTKVTPSSSGRPLVSSPSAAAVG